MADTDAKSFEEFWPFYLSQHNHPMSRKLHFIGTSIAIGCVALAPLAPTALMLAPVAGYGFAWVGHFVYEKNKPATFGGLKSAAYSLLGDFRMWKHIAMGTLDLEEDRLAKLAAKGEPALHAA